MSLKGPVRDWTEENDSDDEPVAGGELAERSVVRVDDGEGTEESPAPQSDDKPVASLLSRLGGLSTDPQPSSSSPSPGPSSSAPAPPPPSAPRERPKPNTSNPLFGKALAGVKSRAPPTGPSAPAAQASAALPVPVEKEGAAEQKLTEKPVEKIEDKAPEVKEKQEKKDGRMTGNNGVNEAGGDDDGWGGDAATNGHTNGNGNANTNGDGLRATPADTPDASMSDAGSGLISNAFEVQVKLADQQADPNSPLYSVKAFEQLPIHPDLLKGIYASDFKKPSKIQERALPMLLNNPPRNLIGQSQSGTGKTAAFTLNMLSRVDPSLVAPQALCLAPSRELARQIQDVVDKIGQFTQIKTMLAVPGSWSRNVRIDKHILIGTPGTLLDMLSRGGKIFDPKQIRVFVLDEADQLISMQGLGDQTTRIKRMLPPGVQNVLFSATFPEEVKAFAEDFAPEANQLFLKKEEVTVEAIKQLYLECEGENSKFEALSELYGCMTIGQSIVFCKRRETADRIADRLTAEGHSVLALHGEKGTRDRDEILDGFRDGKTKVLITTNVAARGIDIQQVNMVVNYDVPDMGPEGSFAPDIETYIHRIGRTGRFGRKGCSIIFVHDQRSKEDVQTIMRETGRAMKRINAKNESDLEQLEKALKIAMKSPS